MDSVSLFGGFGKYTIFKNIFPVEDAKKCITEISHEANFKMPTQIYYNETRKDMILTYCTCLADMNEVCGPRYLYWDGTLCLFVLES